MSIGSTAQHPLAMQRNEPRKKWRSQQVISVQQLMKSFYQLCSQSPCKSNSMTYFQYRDFTSSNSIYSIVPQVDLNFSESFQKAMTSSQAIFSFTQDKRWLYMEWQIPCLLRWKCCSDHALFFRESCFGCTWPGTREILCKLALYRS